MRAPSPIRKLAVLAALGVAVGATSGIYAAFSSTAASSGSFSAAASFCPTTNPSPNWVTGIEHGVVSTNGGGLFDYEQGATADSTTTRSGAYSLRLTSPSGSTAYAAKLSGGSALVMRFALRFASLPSGNITSLAGTYVNSGSNLTLGYRASDQKLVLSFNGIDTQASSITVSAGTWYVIDLRAQVGSNPRTGDWRIDGVTQSSTSSAETGTSNFLAAFGSITASDVFTVNLDDIVASDSASDYPIGDGRVLALRPDANDTHNNPGNFSIDGGGSIGSTAWERLDEVPMNSTSDRVEQDSSSSSSYLGFAFEDTTKSCIRAVSAIMAYRSADTSSNHGRMVIRDGTTERTVYSGDMSESSLHYRSAVITPAAALWSQSALNGLVARVGYSTDASPDPYWESLLLEYEATD